MKKILLIIPIFFSALSMNAQWHDNDSEIRTLLGNNNFTLGGYFGFGGGYALIDDKDAILMSGRGVCLINRGLGFGFTGTGFINDYHYDAVLDDDVNLTGGYGGLIIEPILFPRSPIHIAFPIVAGVGGIAYTRSDWYQEDWHNWEFREARVEDSETFLVFEPGVEIELNMLKFFRLAGGVSYRYTTDIDLIDTPGNVLEGITTSITLKFGKF